METGRGERKKKEENASSKSQYDSLEVCLKHIYYCANSFSFEFSKFMTTDENNTL